jgi:TonB family protein
VLLTYAIEVQRQIAYVFLLAIGLTILTSPPHLHCQDGTVSQRKVLSRVVPQYPELARAMRIDGKVKVLVLVAPNGAPISQRVIGGHPVLAKAAGDAIDKWKWTSAPEQTKELVEIHFRPD